MFAQKKKFILFSHYQMINDILAFNKKQTEFNNLESKDLDKTLSEYIKDYSKAFKK